MSRQDVLIYLVQDVFLSLNHIRCFTAVDVAPVFGLKAMINTSIDVDHQQSPFILKKYYREAFNELEHQTGVSKVAGSSPGRGLACVYVNEPLVNLSKTFFFIKGVLT